MKPVEVTCMAALTPLGNDWNTIADKLKSQETGIQRMAEWDQYKGLNTRLAAPLV
ncbi:MAG: hypothetical protein ACRESZ_20375 [Methylococcales bacterium]